jgi:uncharacterized lipoprotein YddW (UPF0748 family)
MRAFVVLAATLTTALLLAACPAEQSEEPTAIPPVDEPTPEPSPEAPEPCVTVASADHPISRVGGSDPGEVAACVAATLLPASADVVLAGTGDTAQIAAAVHLAHRLEAPLLLAGDDLPDATAAEIARREPTRVIAVGSSDLVGDDALERVGEVAPETRVARLERAADVAAATAAASGEGAAADSAVLGPVGGTVEALLAAGAAGRSGAAFVLAHDGSLPEATVEVLEGVATADIVGAFDVVDDAAERATRDAVGATDARRLSGPSPSEVAASVARAYPADGPIVLADPEDLAATAVAAWISGHDGTVLFTDAVAPLAGTDRYLRLGGLQDREVWLLGDEERAADDLVTALEARYDETAEGGPSPQVRGVWVHLFDDTIKTRQGIEGFLDDAVAANLNTVIVEVVRRHDAYHVSDVLPRAPDPDLEGDLDVLARVLDGGHARGLEVHAWAPLMPVHHPVYDDLDLPADHIWVRHGPDSDDPWVTFDVDGAPNREYLDPGVPAVQYHVAALFAEIVERYPVDAVHLDYPRYPGERYGYNPAALERYRSETGATGQPSPTDRAWSAWRRDQSTALVEGIAEAVRAADPDVGISLAAISMGADPGAVGGFGATRAMNEVLQPWPTWLRDGLVDAIYPMHYFRDGDAQQRSWFRGWLDFDAALAAECRDTRDRGCTIAAGLGAWLNPLEDSRTQLQLALEHTDGAIVYSYQQNASEEPYDALLASLRDGPFAEPAPSPPLR